MLDDRRKLYIKALVYTNPLKNKQQ